MELARSRIKGSSIWSSDWRRTPPVVDRLSSSSSFSSAFSSDDSFYDDSCPYLCFGRHFAATHALVEPCALRGSASRSDQDPFYTGRRGATLCPHAWKAAFCAHNSRGFAMQWSDIRSEQASCTRSH